MKRGNPYRGLPALAMGFTLAMVVPLPVVGQTAAELVSSGAVEIRTRLEPEGSILVGQKVSLWVEVLTNTWFPQPPRFPDSLDATDTVVLPSSSGTSFVDRRGAETYAGIARRYDVYPLRPGKVAVPAVAVTVVVALDSGGRSPEVTLTTEPQSVDAELPEGARGLGLVVASPAITVEDSLGGDPVSKLVGESLERTVATRVEDSVSMLLPGADLRAPDGIATYVEPPQFSDRSERGRVSGERIDAVTYVFEQEGEFVVPEQQIRWWDTSADELRIEVLAAVEITVGRNPALAEERFGSPDDEEALAPAPVDAVSEPDGSWRRYLAGALGAALAVWLLVRLARRRAAASEAGPTGPRESEVEAFDRLRGSLRHGTDAEIYRDLLAWLGCLGEICGITTWRELAQRSDDEALAREIEGLETELFGSSPSAGGLSSVRSFERGLAAARSRVLRGHAERHAASGLPPALNPASSR